METYRKLLKSDRWDEWREQQTDQTKGIQAPPQQKPFPEDATLVDLIPSQELAVGQMPLIEAIRRRRSRRQYTETPLTMEELSFLLWATQGIDEKATREMQEWLSTKGHRMKSILRTVPSAGARNPFESYIIVNRVTDLQAGLYRYLPLRHKLLVLRPRAELSEGLTETFSSWVRNSAVIFVWTVLPYRTEWRYTFLSHKMIAQEAGHICQNLYLASEAIGAGACAIGAYDQDKVDTLLEVDGVDEFAIYVAPVGKVDPASSFHGEH
jgi:SagB-type dehydrogenase family enzyme